MWKTTMVLLTLYLFFFFFFFLKSAKGINLCSNFVSMFKSFVFCRCPTQILLASILPLVGLPILQLFHYLRLSKSLYPFLSSFVFFKKCLGQCNLDNQAYMHIVSPIYLYKKLVRIASPFNLGRGFYTLIRNAPMWDLTIHPLWRPTSSQHITISLTVFVRSHISWVGEQNILYMGNASDGLALLQC